MPKDIPNSLQVQLNARSTDLVSLWRLATYYKTPTIDSITVAIHPGQLECVIADQIGVLELGRS